MRPLNQWVYSAALQLAGGASGGVAVDLGTSNRPPGLVARVRVRPSAILLGAHELRLHEDRAITNTSDPASGRHRDRLAGDDLPEWLRLKLGMEVDDHRVFHGPGTFTDGGGGVELWRGRATSGGSADSGDWLLVPPANPAQARYYLFEVVNLEAQAVDFTIEVEHQFVDPTQLP